MNPSVDLLRSFWSGKRVLITGHSGFKGSWLSYALAQYGAQIFGYGLDAHTSILFPYLSNIYGETNQILDDIINIEHYSQIISSFKPDIVVHLAAFATVLPSYSNPKETWTTNVLGSQCVLELVRCSFPHLPVLVITTDKVYCDHSLSEQASFSESSSLSGFSDPYSASKAACEFLVSSYRYSYPELKLFTARAGNVLGGGDRSPHRLLPDIIRASNNQSVLEIRNPHSTRPWQHILDTVHAYLSFMKSILLTDNTPHTLNFAPPMNTYSPTVLEILEIARHFLPDISFHVSNPSLVKSEFNCLYLDSSLASISGVWPSNIWSPELSVKNTILWEQESARSNPLLATEHNFSNYLEALASF